MPTSNLVRGGAAAEPVKVRRLTDRLLATYHRTHGVTYFHGCYSVGDDTL